jgi:hypothetical protein
MPTFGSLVLKHGLKEFPIRCLTKFTTYTSFAIHQNISKYLDQIKDETQIDIDI